MEPYRHYGSKPRPAAIRWMTWFILGAGIVMLLFSVMRPSRDGIPGWQPVNRALEATLAAHDSEVDAAHPGKDGPASTTPTPTTGALALITPSSPVGEQGATSPAPSGRLDLNSATEAEFDGLPGIGPAKAKAIAAYRQEHGPFRSLEQLLEVKGIGPKLLEQIRPVVSVSNTPKDPG